jgi:cell division protein FtsI/penicillin-binding protein 2
LDRNVQAAAEDAVDPVGQQAMLVAVRPSTGELLAVAQNAAADAEGPVALAGRYPPGSTAKIVTADAALSRGLTPSSPVGCPAAVTIGGREVPNNDRLDLGTVPLVTAFARSCNTTFAQLAADGGAADLPAAARRLGLGADYVVPGATTVTGSVPPADDVVRRAANGFGQGDVVASPLGMALAAATVDRGAPVTPQLVMGRPTTVVMPPDVPQPAVIDGLRAMMRQVVVAGTATQLAPLGDVSGKTGTAQYGAGDRAHGWFVGYRGDLAFAVLLVDAGSSAPAVEAAGRFLRAQR